MEEAAMIRAGKITVRIAGIFVFSYAWFPTTSFGQTGACCQTDGTCSVGPVSLCGGSGGEYMGDGTQCQGDNNGDLIDDVCPCVRPPLPGCGDCNVNGIQDSEDLTNPAACVPPSDCGDCNTTYLPDGCETIPGICTTALADGNWSEPTSWNLAGDYPDNIGHVAGSFVTIPPGTFLALDTAVEIEGLSLSSGSLLAMPETLTGDLNIRTDAAGGLRVIGEIDIQGDRQIHVSGGTMLLADTGRYFSSSIPVAGVRAHVQASRIILKETLCGMDSQFSLTGQMTAGTSRDFAMDGTDAALCAVPGANQSNVARGGKTPPILRINPGESETITSSKSALPHFNTLNIGGDFQMLHMAQVCVGCEIEPNDPFPDVRLGGSFDNRAQYPSLFDWSGGKLTLTDSGQTHLFEVGGLDLGPVAAGFQTTTSTEFDDNPHRNFSINTIEVEPGATVQFENAVLNSSSTGQEALYVENLVLGAGSTLSLGDSNIYYCNLSDAGALVLPDGVGRLLQAECDPSIPTVSEWGVAAMALLLSAAGTILTSRRAVHRRAN